MEKKVTQTPHFKLIMDMPRYFKEGLYYKISEDAFNNFSVIDKNSPVRIHFRELFAQMVKNNTLSPEFLQINTKESRAIATMLGLGVCDALGATTEFIPFKKEGYDIVENGFADIEQKIRKRWLKPRSGKITIWTDDCSMALCMADNILLNSYKIVPKHLRYLFIMWIEHGLNNGGRPHSIGLGGNIAISMKQFHHKQTDYCDETNRFNNGNGSLMRLAPVPVAFRDDKGKAMQFAAMQSRTTHNGEQAEQCCRLLTSIIVDLINREDKDDWKQVINNACAKFTTDCPTVRFLAKAEKESKELFDQQVAKHGKTFKKFNSSIQDRNWNWKDQDFTYSKCRYQDKPGYVGSYCMDALSMALHTVWFSKSFKEVAVKNTNMGGDCDTVGAIAGQIAGAIYGVTDDMLKLYSEMDDFKTKKFQLFLKAYYLAKNEKLDM